MRSRSLLTLIIVFSLTATVLGEEPAILISEKMTRENALNVYIDCSFCDMQYLKENLNIVNYVRDRKVADVHILITRITTGSGGQEVSIEFIGQEEFISMNDILVFNLEPNYTSEDMREAILHHMSLGLVPYILQTPFAGKMTLQIDQTEDVIEEGDPWNYWVFSARASGNMNKNNNKSSYNLNTGWSAHRITDKMKFKSDANYSYQESTFYTYNEETETTDTIISTNIVYNFNNLYVRSIGNHWGIGAWLKFRSDIYQNLKSKYEIKPAVEYNLFDYDEASRKQLRVGYAAGPLYNNYFDSTDYDKTSELCFEHTLDVDFRYIAEWGSINASVWRSNYLNDFKLSETGMNLGWNLKLIKGLSLYSHMGVNFPHNQIQLRKQDLSTEDVLLRRYEMATDYSFWGYMGFSYTFGSIYNNFVNPRFD